MMPLHYVRLNVSAEDVHHTYDTYLHAPVPPKAMGGTGQLDPIVV